MEIADAGSENDGASPAAHLLVHDIRGKHYEPIDKGGCLGRVGELGVGDDAEARLSAFQTPQLDLYRNTARGRALDVRARDGDVFFICLEARLYKPQKYNCTSA